MANGIDPKRANVALGLAVARWKKLPDDSIAASLDNPSEWLQEAALMNQFLPAHLAKAGFSFIAVLPNEFSVGIKTVKQYAGLIYKHMVPVPIVTDIVGVGDADISDSKAFAEAGAEFEKAPPEKLVFLASRFVAIASDVITGEDQ